jgi:uncharacterized membrane protein
MMRRVWSRLIVAQARAQAEAEAEKATARPARSLDEVVHSILMVGFVVSAALFLIGLGLSLWQQQPLPSATVNPAEAFRLILALQPVGFLSLGLVVLIATPMLRAVGSILVFVWQRDWRYAGVTLLVLLIMIASIALGRI